MSGSCRAWGLRRRAMTENPLFPKLGSTSDLWNAAIEAAALEVERVEADGPARARIAALIRKLKRPT